MSDRPFDRFDKTACDFPFVIFFFIKIFFAFIGILYEMVECYDVDFICKSVTVNKGSNFFVLMKCELRKY